jgi:hypothetical protein
MVGGFFLSVHKAKDNEITVTPSITKKHWAHLAIGAFAEHVQEFKVVEANRLLRIVEVNGEGTVDRLLRKRHLFFCVQFALGRLLSRE